MQIQLNKEQLQGYLSAVESKYGKEMRMKVEHLVQEGYLGYDLLSQLVYYPLVLTEEQFNQYAVEIEHRYGMAMKSKVEKLYHDGHLGIDLLSILIGKQPQNPIVPQNKNLKRM